MSPWGWSPSGGGVVAPPHRLFLHVGDGLQAAVDSLIGSAGEIWLDSGTFYAVPSSPSTILTIPGTVNVVIRGVNQADTIIGSPVLIETTLTALENLSVRPSGGAYGVKIFSAGLFLARNWMRNVTIGASSYAAGDGPTDGLLLDGAGVFLAERLTCSFNTRHGMVIDSTSVEPNTTCKFDVCSFVQNGSGGTGYGAKILASALCIEFNGGNAEGNVSGEIYAEDTAVFYSHGMDYESSESKNNQLEIQNANAVTLLANNFVKAAGTIPRAVLIQGTNGLDYSGNRFQGFGTTGVMRVSASCTNVRQGVNHIFDGSGWIEDYSR